MIKSQPTNTTVVLDSTSYPPVGTISVGQNVSSTVIPSGWNITVASCNAATYTITLSSPIPTLPSLAAGTNTYPIIYFGNNNNTAPITLQNTNNVSNSTTINFASTSGISVGMILSCSTVPYYFNCFVVSITNSRTIVVSSPITITTSSSINFTPAKIYNIYGYSSASILYLYFGHCYFSATRIA